MLWVWWQAPEDGGWAAALQGIIGRLYASGRRVYRRFLPILIALSFVLLSWSRAGPSPVGWSLSHVPDMKSLSDIFPIP